jgi:hypothetical protein
MYGGQVRFWGGDDEEQSASDIATPKWTPDPYVTSSQATLSPFYTSILEGKPNAYYAPIGEFGGPEAQKALALTNRDITNSVNENMTRRGMSRSGVAGDVISKAIGDSSTKFNYTDFQRALEGRKWLGTWGSTGLEGVRSAGLTNQGQQNSFNMNAAQFDLNKLTNEQNQDANEDAMWGNLLSSGIGAIGNVFGMGMLSKAFNPAASAAASTITGGMGAIDSSPEFAWNPPKLNSSVLDYNNVWGI